MAGFEEAATVTGPRRVLAVCAPGADLSGGHVLWNGFRPDDLRKTGGGAGAFETVGASVRNP